MLSPICHIQVFATMDCNLPDSSVYADSSGKNPGVGLPCPPPGDLPDPGIEPRSTVLLHCKFFTTKPWRKPRIISVCNLSLSIIYPLSIYHLIAVYHLFIYRSIYISIPISTDNIQSCPALCNPRDYTVHGIL